MPFDYKKEYKEFYMPLRKPSIIDVPAMNYIAVRGTGNPNDEEGEYKASIGLLYAIAYTIKMSYKGNYKIDGFFEYVVPPLEGLWCQPGMNGIDYSRKEAFSSITRFREPGRFRMGCSGGDNKKKTDFSKVEFLRYDEGMCVQCMHVGSYDNEPETIALMDGFARNEGYDVDINGERFHHEIYLSDPRKADPAKLKTVIRHPVKSRKG